MPTLASANRAQLGYKLEGSYPTNFGVLQGGNGALVDLTNETFDFTIRTEISKALRSDRQVPDIVPVSAQVGGGFGFEHKYKEYDWVLQGVMQQDYTVYGTSGVSAAIATLTLAADTITAGAAPTGNDAFTGLHKDQWIKIIPDAGASATVKDYFRTRAFRLDSLVGPTTTVLNLHPSTQINTAVSGGSLSNAFIATSRAYNGNTMKSYSLEVGHTDISRFRQYVGQIPSKMELKISDGAIVTGMFDFLGKTMVTPIPTSTGLGTPAAPTTFTPANAVRGVFDVFEGGVAISTTTFVKSMDLSIDNSLRIQGAVGVFGAAGIAAGTMQIRGKATVYFADSVMYEKFLDGTASSFQLPVLDIDGNGYVYHLPRIKYTATKVNASGQDQDSMLEMDFQALPDITAGSDTLGKSVAIYRVGVSVA